MPPAPRPPIRLFISSTAISSRLCSLSSRAAPAAKRTSLPHGGIPRPLIRLFMTTTGPSSPSTRGDGRPGEGEAEDATSPAAPPPPSSQRLTRPSYSSDVVDVAALDAEVARLLGPEGRWRLAKGGEALERTFRFKTFARTWDFMTAVALRCKLANHHPEWSNAFNTTFVRWTTHSPKGLSAKDVELAAACDALALDFGEIAVAVDEGDSASCEGLAEGPKGLADRVAAVAGDCCVPKSAKR